MLTLLFGRAGSGKTNALYEAIRQRVADKKPGALLIVPEQYSYAAERELVARSGPETSLYAEVLSFTRLAARVQDEMGGMADPPLDEGGRMLTMRMALTAVASALTLYGALGRRPEFLKGLLDTIDELKQCDLSPSHLLDAALWAEGSLQHKLRDLAYIAGAYENLSQRRDPRDALTRLADTVGESSVAKAALFVDGFSDFTAQEGRVLHRLLTKGVDMTLALTCGGPDDDNPLFYPAVTTATRLRRWAEEQGHKVQITHLQPKENRPEDLSLVERHLFSTNLPESRPLGEHVELYTANTPMEECELAAARIRALVMDGGYRYRDIAVSARGFADYETTCEQVFARWDIPVHLSRKADILEKPILLLFTAALDILDGGWRYESVFRYLRTGLAGISQRETDVLEEYVRRWNIYGTMWTKEADWRENPAGYRADFTPEEERLLRHINTLRHRVRAPLQALSEAGRRAKTAAQQGEALYAFLETIHLPSTLEEKAAHFRETGRETLAAEYRQIWETLLSALEQAHAILGDSPMDQREFFALIRLVLSQYSLGTIPQTLDRVSLGDLDRTRSRDLKCLIVLGATDQRLPTPKGQQGVLTESERGRLLELGLRLSETAEEGLNREMALIYHAFTAPKERLILSWPLSEGGGENRKSTVFTRLETLFNRASVPISAIDRRRLYGAPAPAFDLALQAPHRPEDSLAAQVFAYFQGGSPEAKARLQGVLDKIEGGANGLSAETATKLYGETLRLSASRLESFNACRFRHFMQYGLRARPFRPAELDAPMAGSFLHYVLEQVTRDIRDGGGFSAPIAKDWESLTQGHIETYARLYFGDLDEKSPRFRYLFKRLVRETCQVVADMVEELSLSDFSPLEFELTFGGKDSGGLPPLALSDDHITLSLHGTVDRVDGWIKGDTLYLRVVDYKTGRKTFSLSDIWYGVGVQTLLYLSALTRTGSAHFGHTRIEPAAALYTPARDPILSLPKHSSPQEIEKARQKTLLRSGLILRDPELIAAMEQGDTPRFLPVKFLKDGSLSGDSLVTAEELGRISRHINQTLLTLGRELRAGDTAPRPYTGSVTLPCTYCDYRGACHHNPETDGVRFLKALSKSQVLEKLEEVPPCQT